MVWMGRTIARIVALERTKPATRRAARSCRRPASPRRPRTHQARGDRRGNQAVLAITTIHEEEQVPDPIVYGFPRSTYVNIVRLILTHKDVPYVFHDLEPVMGKPEHLALHPFDRVPILRHGDFTLYETSAIAAYIDEAFDGPKLTPGDPQQRGRMNQWISAVNAYYYPYLIYHVSHERNVFPQLGVPSDEKVVAHALPKVEICLQVLERELSGGNAFLLGPQLTLADFYMLPIIHAFGFTPEAQAMYQKFPSICTGRERMEALPTLKR